jgi:YYY domain-containing protein
MDDMTHSDTAAEPAAPEPAAAAFPFGDAAAAQPAAAAAGPDTAAGAPLAGDSAAAHEDAGAALAGPAAGETPGEPAAGEAAAAPPRRVVSLTERLVTLALLLALAGGAYFRYTGIDWDHGQHLHPDERFLTIVSTTWQPVWTLDAYFDNTHNTLNPYNFSGTSHFVYGPLPVVISIYTGVALNKNCDIVKPVAQLTGANAFKTIDCNNPPFTAYDGIYIVGRALAALFDLLSLLVLFLTGRRLYGPRVAALGVLLMAGAVMLIQQSHFYTVDAYANLFVTLALYFAVRASQEGRWYDYALFGLMVAASVASKVNTAPVAAMIVVAGVLWFVRRTDAQRAQTADLSEEVAEGQASETDAPGRAASPSSEPAEQGPEELWWLPAARRLVVLLVISGLVAALGFRVFQPYAFGSQNESTSFINIFQPYPPDAGDKPPLPGLNPTWWSDLQSARLENSGEIDSPPGKQWTNRTPLLFPWLNMVLWGLGLPLGLMAWLGWALAGWQLLAAGSRPDRREAWHRHAIPFIWIGVYFLFLGMSFVQSMRYMLPLYPFLCLFAAWALVALWDCTRARAQAFDGRGVLRTVRRPALAALLIAVTLAGTWGWAWAFTRIYNRPITREAASRWMFTNVPSASTITIATTAGDVQQQVPIQPGYLFSGPGVTSITPFHPVQTGSLKSIRINHLSDPNNDPDPETFKVVISADPSGASPLTGGEISADFSKHTTSPYGDPYDVPLSDTNASLAAGQTYYLYVEATAGGPVQVFSSHLANENWDDPLPLRIDGNDPFSNWYQSLTSSPDTLIAPYWEDDENKRAMLAANLDEADYVILSSSRAVWSITRLPMRYPMMIDYYNSLMDGSLGFDLVASFHSAPNIGPLHINDVTAQVNFGDALPLPQITYQPYLSAEEAFNVYDHPPVWIFKKNPAKYSSENTRAILARADLAHVMRLTPRQASTGGAATELLLDNARWAADQIGGTWSEMFNRQSLINQSDVLAVIGWWLFMLVLGWITFPLMHLIVGGLPDRGYPLAKTAALLLLAWSAWFLGSYQVLPFTRLALVGLLLVLAAINALIARRRMEALVAFWREQRPLILVTEIVTVAFFLLFVAIRWQNPDLWHPFYGGEKPMDVAYLNAVIKTTYFPPFDPWFSGGYLNYYYFGFVVVAVPIKLLGVVPTSAYNLALPTLYALTAIGAFSAAYNLVAYAVVHGEVEEEELPAAPAVSTETPTLGAEPVLTAISPAESVGAGASPAPTAEPLDAGETGAEPTLAAISPAESVGAGPAPAPAMPTETPTLEAELAPAQPPAPQGGLLWRAVVAGLIAALLVTTLGNLGQAQLLVNSWEKLALENQPQPPPSEGVGAIVAKFANAARGFSMTVLEGRQLPIGPGQWYWDASRVINFDPGEAGPISEFPFFTFLYADLHAHMIALPLTLFMLCLVLGWVTAAPDWDLGGGGSWQSVLLKQLRAKGPLFFVLAVAVGASRPVNTWDWPTYLAISGAAFVFAGVRREGRLTFDGVLSAAVETVLLLVVSTLLFWPFSQTYAQAYSSVEAWQGSHTDLTPYLIVHGLFLFILASFMLHELWLTVRAVLNMEDAPIVDIVAAALLGAVVLAIVLAVGLRLKEIWIAPVAVPLIAAAAFLTLRPALPGAPLPTMRRAAMALVTLALILTLMVELIVLKGDVGRMNTVFKFYLQVWVLLGVTAGAAVVWLWPRLGGWLPVVRQAWIGVLSVLIVCALLYPLTAAPAKIDDRWVKTAPQGLDGMAFIPAATYDDNGKTEILRYDYDALRWMQDNLPGSPVIAEAPTGPSGNPQLYHWAARVAIYTGNPTVIGWDWHQRQQRAALSDDPVGRRTADMSQFYNTADAAQAMQVIARYGIRYIYVGPIERVFYTPDGLNKFDSMVADHLLRVVYQNDGAKLYEVVSGQ